jgi:hypothetical protein
MPQYPIGDGDLSGCDYISSQFAASLTNPNIGDPLQWFGKIARFGYTLTLPDDGSGGKTPVDEQQIKDAIKNKLITSCRLNRVAYTSDPFDATIAYATGELVIVAVAGSPIPSGTYKFTHSLKHVWRFTETKLS